ncbi:MAG: hypothetical protein GY816_02160 [Cytophagales bacterium]|nr:hypothetical protein [Cytophagales bacterium]
MRIFIPFLLVLIVSCQTQELNGEELFEEGKFIEAINFYTSYLESNGYDPEIAYNRGRAYEEMGKLKESKADYDLVLSKDERHLNARLSLSRLAYEKGNYSRSLILSGEALKFHENSAQGHFLLARARHQLGYATSALEAYNAAISQNKSFGEAYLYRGALKTTLKIKSACEDFKTAEKMGVDGSKAAVKKYCH